MFSKICCNIDVLHLLFVKEKFFVFIIFNLIQIHLHVIMLNNEKYCVLLTYFFQDIGAHIVASCECQYLRSTNVLVRLHAHQFSKQCDILI